MESGVNEILVERYFNDTILLIVTARDNVPSVRSVDCFYYEGSFWIVTDTRCNYVKEIQSNKNVMISDGGHNRFWCNAIVAGHPLEEENKAIRDVYLKVFHHWYKEVNNEELETVCFVKATPYKGYVHKNKIGYNFNIFEDKVQIDDITHHIDVKLEPFW
jgi:general stress protein 26